MSTTDTTSTTVAGVDAYQHGYATGYGMADLDAAAREVRTANIAAELGITGATMAEWTDGIHDGLLDVADEARRAKLLAR